MMGKSNANKHMHDPPHVGEILRELYLTPLEISVTQLAEQIGVSRQAISRLINERSSISADMAIRLSIAFETTPEFWLNLAKEYELWHAKQAFGSPSIHPHSQWHKSNHYQADKKK